MNKRKFLKAIYRLLNLPKGKFLLYYLKNKIYHFYLKFVKSNSVAFPSNLMLELTNQCNLACTTCPRVYKYGDEMDKGKMTIQNAKKIIDETWPYLDSIGLTGMGETFIYNDISEIVDYIKFKNKGIIISVSTNAMLPNFIELVSKVVNKIDTIQISIDGLDEVYEKIRKNASFTRLDKNLKALVKMCQGTKTTLMLNMVVTKDNYFQMPELIKYAEEIGIYFLDFSQFNLAAVTNVDVSYYNFYKSNDFLEVLNNVDEIKINIKKLKVNSNFKVGKGFNECPFPWSHFYVCWNGEVAPCCAKPFPKEKTFGNVFDSKLMEVLNNDEYFKFRKAWFNNKTVKFCDKCHFTSQQ